MKADQTDVLCVYITKHKCPRTFLCRLYRRFKKTFETTQFWKILYTQKNLYHGIFVDILHLIQKKKQNISKISLKQEMGEFSRKNFSDHSRLRRFGRLDTQQSPRIQFLNSLLFRQHIL